MAKRDWSKLQGLMFTAKTLVDGLYGGGHASPRHGPGVEFHDYRQYVPGDDPSGIDWKLFGRTDRYYLRRYQYDTNLQAHLLVDCSASMAFRSLNEKRTPQAPSKMQVASELAAAIAFLMTRQGDQVGLATFRDGLRDYMPPRGTWGHLEQICKILEMAKLPRRPANAAKALDQLHRRLTRRGLVILISDLLDEPEPMFQAMDRLRLDRFEVIVFQVLTPDELNLSGGEGRRLNLVDPETLQQVSTNVLAVQSTYQQVMAEHLATLKRGCVGRNIDYQLLRTDQPVADGLRRYLSRRGG